MTYKLEIIKKLKTKKATISVIGLGYVGLPLLERFFYKGYKCIGIDSDLKKIGSLNKKYKGVSKKMKQRILFSNEYKNLLHADIIIICLPTPLKVNKSPDLSYIKSALKSLKPFLKKGQALSLESTTYPETTEEIIVPFIKKLQFEISKNFFVIYSPERESPLLVRNLDSKYILYNTPKICSEYSDNCYKVGYNIYCQIVKKVVRANSIKNAEMAKMVENIYRAVNIGLVNELKMLAHKMKIDIHEVLRLAGTKPFGFTKFTPGPGLGGHCIPIDPFYLNWKAKQYNFDTKFIKLAGKINGEVTEWVLKNMYLILKKHKIDLKTVKILIIGVAYKKNIDDIRESPAIVIMKNLIKKKIKYDYCDPHIPVVQINGVNKKSISLNYNKFKSYNLSIIITDHDAFNKKKLISKCKILLDTRGMIKKPKKDNFYSL